jgi:predicted nicotinamide N-methyase
LEVPLSQELSLRFDSLYQWMSRKYELELIKQKIANHTYQIYKISNIDPVLEEIIKDHVHPDQNTPYWTELWPSAIALGEFIAKRKLNGKTVLGLGSGVGAVEMVAQQQGAKVILSDNQEDALRLVELNWIVNFGEMPQLIQLDWRQPNLDQQFEILLASDVAYEERLFWPLIDVFRKLLTPNGEIYLSEPNRPIAKGFFDLLKKQGFEFEQFKQKIHYQEKEMNISVYRIWGKT